MLAAEGQHSCAAAAVAAVPTRMQVRHQAWTRLACSSPCSSTNMARQRTEPLTASGRPGPGMAGAQRCDTETATCQNACVPGSSCINRALLVPLSKAASGNAAMRCLSAHPRRPPARQPTHVCILLGCDGLHQPRDEPRPLLRAVPARDRRHRHRHRRAHFGRLVAEACWQGLADGLFFLSPHLWALVVRRLSRPVLPHQLLQHGGRQLSQPKGHIAAAWPRPGARQQHCHQGGAKAGCSGCSFEGGLPLLPRGRICSWRAQGASLCAFRHIMGDSRCHTTALPLPPAGCYLPPPAANCQVKGALLWMLTWAK